ncbi:hypothetical protein [Luteipulveratus mongoliensis]|uniref:Uncharacterized protein n=1 Tax=Luteipulveratus mongoliensis TaxID=571913 RepID=A0A0K1JGE4_9MICO|nr:hypothetical protein [Luteipulveratus mongoliensis]AKU15782.1 hypothetical protein VV02_07805 [Luteipulveratus mongoliensis]
MDTLQNRHDQHEHNLSAMHAARRRPTTCAFHSDTRVANCLACHAAARALHGRSAKFKRSIEDQAVAEGHVHLVSGDAPEVAAAKAKHKLRLADWWVRVRSADPMPDDVAADIQAALIEASNERQSQFFATHKREVATS